MAFEWRASAMITAIPGGELTPHDSRLKILLNALFRQCAQQASLSASISLWNQALAC
jgi:hypothetical protein